MTRILGLGGRGECRLGLTRPTHALLLAASVLGLIGQTGCGTTTSTRSSVTSRQSASTGTTGTTGALPLPNLGETVDLQPVSGNVLIELPSPSAAPAPGGQQGFIRLSRPRQAPVGTVVDATSGLVRLTTATATPARSQTGDFRGGIFKILQSRTDGGLTELLIRDNPSRRTCGPTGTGTASGQLSQRILGVLRGNAKGRFRTNGEFSAATVRGTVWGVRDRCDGTLTVDTRGEVVVRDFRLKKDIILHSGQTYLVKAG
jgi:hypothetical protein